MTAASISLSLIYSQCRLYRFMQVVHARTAFNDSETQKRKLLRLWLSLPFSQDDAEGISSINRIKEMASVCKSGAIYIANYLWVLAHKHKPSVNKLL